jgi:hypothetical protein
MAEQAAHGLASRFRGMVFGEGYFYTVMAGLTERIDLFFGFSRFDHVMKLLVISIFGHELCFLFA